MLVKGSTSLASPVKPCIHKQPIIFFSPIIGIVEYIGKRLLQSYSSYTLLSCEMFHIFQSLLVQRPLLWYIKTNVYLRGGVFVHTLFTVLLVIVSVLLIAVVLLQSGRSAGLAGAISGGAEQLMGKQKARGIDAVLQKATVVLATLFIVLAVLVAFVA